MTLRLIPNNVNLKSKYENFYDNVDEKPINELNKKYWIKTIIYFYCLIYGIISLSLASFCIEVHIGKYIRNIDWKGVSNIFLSFFSIRLTLRMCIRQRRKHVLAIFVTRAETPWWEDCGSSLLFRKFLWRGCILRSLHRRSMPRWKRDPRFRFACGKKEKF